MKEVSGIQRHNSGHCINAMGIPYPAKGHEYSNTREEERGFPEHYKTHSSMAAAVSLSLPTASSTEECRSEVRMSV